MALINFDLLKKTIVDERFVLIIIFINSVVLFLYEFSGIKALYNTQLYVIDYFCTVIFFLEMIVKINLYSFSTYWRSGWNKFDFLIVLLSSPMLLSPFLPTGQFGIIYILRMSRLFRLLKLAKFIPDHQSLWKGINRAIRASIGFIMALFIYNFILSIWATFFFSDIAPEYFGNPLISMYSIFKIFTIEGWYEIPDVIAQNSSLYMGIFAKIYFIFTVLTGGIIGFSLANAVFVDEMVLDNNDVIKDQVDNLKMQILSELESIKLSHNKDLKQILELIQQIKNDKS